MSIKKLPAIAQLREKTYSIPTLHLDVPNDFEMGDLLIPGAWAHFSSKLRPGYEVIARRSDLAWRLHLQVVETGIGFASVHVISEWTNPDHKPARVESEDQPLPDLPENYRVSWIPGNRSYSVRTVDPSEIVSGGHKTKLAAHLAAIAHAQKVLGKAA